MGRVVSHLGIALMLSCTGETLSAGSGGDAASSAPTTLALLSSMVDAFAMDETNVYFTTDDGFLYALPRAGSSPPKAIAAAATAGSKFTDGLALDVDHLYWTSFGDGVSSGAVLSVPKSGGGAVVLAAMQARPMGIAVDDSGVYWSNQGTPTPDVNNLNGGPVPGAVLMLPRAGGAVTSLVITLGVPDAIALDDAGVTWHEQYAIRRVPKTGGTGVTLAATAIKWGSTNLVVSGTKLYWAAHQGDWSVLSVDLGGGTLTTIAPSIQAPGAVALDGPSVFWDVASGPSVGAIDVVPLAGGSASEDAPAEPTAATDAHQASFFLADAKAFFWVEYWQAPALTVAVRTLAR